MKSAAALSDTEIDALARVNGRRRVMGVVVLSLAIGVLGAWVLSLPTDQLGGWKEPALLGVGGLAMLGVGLTLWLTRGPPDTARSLMLRTDHLQRQRSIHLILFAPFALLSTLACWQSTGKIVEGRGGSADFVFLSAILFLSLIHLSSVLGLWSGPYKAVYDDEFSRHLRGRAMMVGFFALLFGVIMIFLLGLTEPALAIRALPLMVLYAVVITSLSYAIMDLRAGRDD